MSKMYAMIGNSATPIKKRYAMIGNSATQVKKRYAMIGSTATLVYSAGEVLIGSGSTYSYTTSEQYNDYTWRGNEAPSVTGSTTSSITSVVCDAYPNGSGVASWWLTKAIDLTDYETLTCTFKMNPTVYIDSKCRVGFIKKIIAPTGFATEGWVYIGGGNACVLDFDKYVEQTRGNGSNDNISTTLTINVKDLSGTYYFGCSTEFDGIAGNVTTIISDAKLT